jgi:uncharacterized peroxidase-related enzyme
MPHIHLHSNDLPGIIGLLHYSPTTAGPLNQLAETLLRGPSTLSPADREIIASCVSYWNDCHFCYRCHGAAAAALMGSDIGLVDEIKAGLPNRPVTPKLRALLHIAHQVCAGGKNVSEQDVSEARKQGASDQEVHDTLLIAAAFCMFNRYVDGLGTWAPETKEAYKSLGKQLAENGYLSAGAKRRSGAGFLPHMTYVALR